MSSSQCCIALDVQGLLHIARCKSGIVPAPRAEALEDYSELITDSASQGRGPRPCDWSDTSTLPAPRHHLRRTRRRSHRRTARPDHRVGTLDAHPGSQSPCYARHLQPGRQVDYQSPTGQAVRAVSAANPLSRSRPLRRQSPLQRPPKSPRPPRARSLLR
jgi:hypothetical protein